MGVCFHNTIINSTSKRHTNLDDKFDVFILVLKAFFVFEPYSVKAMGHLS